MIRIEVVLAGSSKKVEGTIPALQTELSTRLEKFKPTIRIRHGSTGSISVTGSKDEDEHEAIMELIQSVWEDDTLTFES